MPTIVFLGATGGCAGSTLALALQNETNTCRALARNPSKLITSLKAKGVRDSQLKRLTITQGNAKDIHAVKAVLRGTTTFTRPSLPTTRSSRSSRSSRYSVSPPGDAEKGAQVDTIVFGIGAAPVWHFSFKFMTIDDPRVCETTMSVLLQALGEVLVAGQLKPEIVAVSTTGISSGPRDVPLLYYPLYRWALKVPHEDKAGMEKLLWDEAKRGGRERVTGSFVIVRATLLTNSERGVDKVRWGGEGKPVLGWTVGRRDVGEWIYEKVVRRDEERWGEKGREPVVGRDVAVTLAY